MRSRMDTFPRLGHDLLVNWLKRVLILSILIPQGVLFSQWAYSIGGSGSDNGYDIAVDGSGNIYITGYIDAGSSIDFDPGAGTANLSSSHSTDIFFAKYNSSGEYQWAHSIGGSSGDRGLGIAADGSGNVYITGYFSGSNVDFDPGGGTTNLTSNGSGDIFIAKYNSSGEYQWAYNIGVSSGDVGSSIAVDGSGNVYVTGYFQGSNVDFDPGLGTTNLSSNGGYDTFSAKYNSSGEYQWARSIEGSIYNDGGKDIEVDGSGNVYVAGYSKGAVDFDPSSGTANLTSAGGRDIFIARYESGDTSKVATVDFVVDAVKGPALMFYPRRQVLSQGSITGFQVLAEEVTNLTAAEFSIIFDPIFLQTVSVSQGSFLQGEGKSIFLSEYDNHNGRMTVSTVLLGRANPSVNGTGDLAIIEVELLSAGTTILGFAGLEVFKDPDNQTILIEEIIGVLIIISE